MNRKRGLAHLRRLAGLGLPPQAAAVAMLDALHEVVPSAFNRLGFCDGRLDIVDAYCENPEGFRFLRYYFEEVDGRVDYWPSVRSCLARGPGVGYYLPWQTPAFYRSEYYNVVERALGSHHQIDVTIGDQARVYGSMVLARARRDPFTAEDARLLAQVAPYFAHALSAPPCTAEPGDAAEVAAAVIDRKGHVRLADTEYGRLSWMMAGGRSDPGIAARHRATNDIVAVLASRLVAIDEGNEASVPSLLMTNAWGTFRVRADWLHGADGEKSLIRILVTYRAPRAAWMARQLHRVGLTPRLSQVCERLLAGDSQASIADALGLSQVTVNEYVQAVYGHFAVNNRMALGAAVRRLSEH